MASRIVVAASRAPGSSGSHLRRWWWIAAAGVLLGVAVACFTLPRLRRPTSLLDPRAAPIGDSVTRGDWQNLTTNLDLKQRAQVYREALRVGREQIPNWPATAEALIRDFWQSAHAKNFARMALLCPGSQGNDYSTYFSKWTPSPAKSIGAPVPHAKDPQTALYAVKVDFPLFSNKTVKMAVRPAPDGRLIIDGEKTIWW